MRINPIVFWMGIATNIVAAAIIGIATGVYGAITGQPWSVIVGLALSAFGTAASIYGLAVSERATSVDVPNEKLKPLLRTALDNIGMPTRIQENRSAEFEIAAVDFRGLIFSLYRPQKNRQYLCVACNQGFSADQSSQFAKLPQQRHS